MPATLYYTPTSCGAGAFIIASKAGLLASGKVVAYEVNIQNKTVVTGPDAGKSFSDINPKGNVPCLIVDGVVLSEGPSVNLWLADAAPESHLAPAASTLARYQVIDTYNFIGTDIHAGVFGLLWGKFYEPALEALKPFAIKKLTGKLAYVEKSFLLGGARAYLTGDSFSIADAYLYICLSWLPTFGIKLEELNPAVAAWQKKVAELDFVVAAHAAMAAASPVKA
jgi:glutathione S-transferase